MGDQEGGRHGRKWEGETEKVGGGDRESGRGRHRRKREGRTWEKKGGEDIGKKGTGARSWG